MELSRGRFGDRAGGGYLGLDEMQVVFARLLEEQGTPVTHAVMPGSTHQSLSDEGWAVLLGIFRKAAGKE
jgi:hypothetical protein